MLGRCLHIGVHCWQDQPSPPNIRAPDASRVRRAFLSPSPSKDVLQISSPSATGSSGISHLNILRGEMSVVGPRPEDPKIVALHYGPRELESLNVRPGLTSPGTLFAYTRGHIHLDDHAPEASYVSRLLTFKLALDVVYAHQASLGYDLQIIWRTLTTVVQRLAGRSRFPYPPEAAAVRHAAEAATVTVASGRNSPA